MKKKSAVNQVIFRKNESHLLKNGLLKVFFLLFFVVFLTSCGSSRSRAISENGSKKMVSSEEKFDTNPEIEPADKRVYNIISTAKKFEGTRYKYGGTTKKGMDCSGLVYTAYLEEDIPLPRTSRAMSLEGKRLFLKEVTIGDLLFFETNKNKKVINHVGLVVDVLPDHILFIHSTSSRGVIISSLSESYWHNNFVMARRVI
ncbi:C40 family peptidase [Salegentibacter sp. F188]|uniref:C40 family peptidase n=1 Tax=Autumnicola patrickiae TaxID=3075591 RepID=A0ABU3E0I4_9FLAO|nr:C40 family peptidase [Salegentibacter sp. F188]MDT0689398.1 C40 family peptidase [Salegentibacter sp. F188]